eukprot:scaffold700_cov560-Prasinococcus_capsulatus_cf.AAC.23
MPKSAALATLAVTRVEKVDVIGTTSPLKLKPTMVPVLPPDTLNPVRVVATPRWDGTSSTAHVVRNGHSRR